MHLLHVANGKSAVTATGGTKGTARLVSKGTGYAAVSLPFIIVCIGLVLCLCALVPAASDSPVAAKEALLSHPQEVITGPGRYIHIKGRMRVARDAPFTPTADAPFVPMEMWFSENPSLGWCVSTPDALAYCVQDHSAAIVTDPADGNRVGHALRPNSYCQLPFIGHFMWGRELFPMEGSIARCRQSVVSSSETESKGFKHLRVRIQPAQNIETAPVVANAITNWFDPRLIKTYIVAADSHNLIEAKLTTLVDGREIVLLETEKISYCAYGSVPVAMQDEIYGWLSASSQLGPKR